MNERMAPVDSDIVPVRSRSIVAIGASNTGLALIVRPGIGDAEGIDPADFGIEPDDLAEGVDDAEQQRADDQPVEAGIVQEGPLELVEQNGGQKADQGQEYGHAQQKDTGWCQAARNRCECRGIARAYLGH